MLVFRVSDNNHHLQSWLAGMAVITRLYVTSRPVRKCLQSLQLLLGLSHTLCGLGGRGWGGSRSVAEVS